MKSRKKNLMIIKTAAAALSLLLVPELIWAISSSAGTSAAQFLKIGGGARAAAMAEANSALADDVYAVYYNPAGLARTQRPMVGAMHAQYFQGARYEFAAFSLPFGKEGSKRQCVGLAIANLSMSSLERRTEDTDLPAGFFGSSDFSYAMSYAYAPTDRLSLGISAKLVRSKIDVVSGRAWAADMGLLYRIRPARPIVDVALVARHLGTEFKMGDGKDPLPQALVAGAAVEALRGLKLEADVIRYRDTDMLYAFGAEYRHLLFGKLEGALRGGYNNQRNNIDGTKGITFGAGLSLAGFDFDFAWVPFGDLGNTFRYSLLVKF